MKKHFYSHLVEIDSLHVALGDLDLSYEEKQELVSLMESSLHHAILDTTLSQLSENEKKIFLTHITNQNHDEIWNILTKIPHIESKIKDTANALKTKMHRDIIEAKNKK